MNFGDLLYKSFHRNNSSIISTLYVMLWLILYYLKTATLSWHITHTLQMDKPGVQRRWRCVMTPEPKVVGFIVYSMYNTYLVHTHQQPPLFLCVLLPALSDLKGTEIHNSAQNHSSVWDGSQRCSRSPL